MTMSDDWLTYGQAAERLGISPEAVRQKVIRHRWQRTKGNDGKARIQVPDTVPTASLRPHRPPVRTASGQASDVHAIKALEAHVETLKERLAAADAASAARIAQFDDELTAERARADKAIAAFAALADRLDALVSANQSGWLRAVLAAFRGRSRAA